jgi:hypothetical protein
MAILAVDPESISLTYRNALQHFRSIYDNDYAFESISFRQRDIHARMLLPVVEWYPTKL